MIINTRKKMENKLYAQVGALAIRYKLTNCGIKTTPILTFYKILTRGQLIHHKKSYVHKKVDYPSTIVICRNDLHQLDVIGPRYLKTDGHFFSINMLDAYDHRAVEYPHRRKNSIAISGGLLNCWHTMGLPLFSQMYNLLPLRGINRHPHYFGMIIRLCLYLGIQPISYFLSTAVFLDWISLERDSQCLKMWNMIMSWQPLIIN